jgi:hypothetical protein
MNTIRRIAVALSVIALGTGLANAQSTENFSYTIADGAYMSPQTIPVQTFDPLYGTLTGITLSFEGDFLLGVNVYNYGDDGIGNYTANAIGESTITGPAALYMDLMASSATVSNSSLDLFATDNWTALPATNTVTSNPVDLSDYVGGPAIFTNVYFNVVGLTTNYNDIAGDLGFGASGFEGATLDVTYTFTPTPEPATMLMVGTGLLGLGLIRKRIRR